MKLYEVCLQYIGPHSGENYYFIVQCDDRDQAERLAQSSFKQMFPKIQVEFIVDVRQLNQFDHFKAVWFRSKTVWDR